MEQLTFRKYWRRIAARAWDRVKANRLMEIVVASGATLTMCAIQYWVVQAPFWLAAVWVGGTALLTLVGFFVGYAVLELPGDYNYVAGVLADHNAAVQFGGTLRQRAKEISDIPLEQLRHDRRALFRSQVRVVNLLNRSDCTWSTPPEGWRDRASTEHQKFGALIALMSCRYPAEMFGLDELAGHSNLFTGCPLERLVQATVQCCMLIVREIEHPGKYPVVQDPVGFFANTAARMAKVHVD